MAEKSHSSNQASPTLTMCCVSDKIHLPPLLKSPPYLLHLYTSAESDANSFRQNIRAYNTLLACTSFNANIDQAFQGILNFWIHGQIYHHIRPLLLKESNSPSFIQLYVYDTAYKDTNKYNIMQELDEDILQRLQSMLHNSHLYIQSFRQASDIIQANPTSNISILIYADRTWDSRHYNTPTVSDVAVIIAMMLIRLIEIFYLSCVTEIYKKYQNCIRHTTHFIICYYFQKVMMVST